MTVKKIDILFFDAGSGHRSAAHAIESVLKEMQPTWQVRLVDLVDAVKFNRILGTIIRKGISHINTLIRKEKKYFNYAAFKVTVIINNHLNIKRVSMFWKDNCPDMIISVVPVYNQVIFQSILLMYPKTICVTIPVDFEELYSGYWFKADIEQYYLLSSERIIEQAHEANVSSSFIRPISGMVVDQRIYNIPFADRLKELRSLGLDPDLPTGLFMFGGQGHISAIKIAQILEESNLKLNMIFMCGHDDVTYKKLQNIYTSYPKVIVGYVQPPIHYYYYLSDFIIGKAGTITLTEAIITKRPLIAVKSKYMEILRYNEAFIEENDLGVVLTDINDLGSAIIKILSSTSYVEQIKQHYHRGIFEAGKILCDLIEETV